MDPITASAVVAVAGAVQAVCHTIDTVIANTAPELRAKQTEWQIEAIKPWLSIAKWLNEVLGVK